LVVWRETVEVVWKETVEYLQQHILSSLLDVAANVVYWGPMRGSSQQSYYAAAMPPQI
jgi:hypothetical protein